MKASIRWVKSVDQWKPHRAGGGADHQSEDSELSWVGGGSCHLNVDLPADVHPCPQSKVHAIGAIDEFLKLLRCNSFADLPNAEGRAFRADRTERMVKEPRF